MGSKVNTFEQIPLLGNPLWTGKTDNTENITFPHYVAGVNNILLLNTTGKYISRFPQWADLTVLRLQVLHILSGFV